MKRNNSGEIPPSKKYGEKLMGIKESLMKEVASYFEYGKFEMSTPCTLYYPMEFGNFFQATFDTIIGDEKSFCLKRKGGFTTVIGFETDRGNESAGADIYFLRKLLDFMWLDKMEKERKPNSVYA